MEKKLFHWDGWDQMDTADFIFYNCKLNVDIGNFKKGTKFKSIIVSYENGTLILQDDNGSDFKVSLELKVATNHYCVFELKL